MDVADPFADDGGIRRYGNGYLVSEEIDGVHFVSVVNRDGPYRRSHYTFLCLLAFSAGVGSKRGAETFIVTYAKTFSPLIFLEACLYSYNRTVRN